MMPTENWPRVPDPNPVFNPEACAHGYTYGQYCAAYGEYGGAVDEVHIRERAQTGGQTNRGAAERWLNLSTDPAARAQGHAVLAVLDCLDAVTAAVNAALPGMLRGFDAIGEAVREAHSARAEALGRIADRLEEQVRALNLVAGALLPPKLILSEGVISDEDITALKAEFDRQPDGWTTHTALPPVEVDTLHAAERLRMKLDRVEELATKALHGDSFYRAVLARQVLDVLAARSDQEHPSDT